MKAKVNEIGSSARNKIYSQTKLNIYKNLKYYHDLNKIKRLKMKLFFKY